MKQVEVKEISNLLIDTVNKSSKESYQVSLDRFINLIKKNIGVYHKSIDELRIDMSYQDKYLDKYRLKY